MSQLLILATCHSRKGQCLTAHDLATACAGFGRQTVLLDLTPRPLRSRQRGRAGKCGLASLMAALADGAVDVGQMISSTEVPGLGLLTARPIAADDADAVTELFIKVCERLLGTNDRVVVARRCNWRKPDRAAYAMGRATLGDSEARNLLPGPCRRETHLLVYVKST